MLLRCYGDQSVSPRSPRSASRKRSIPVLTHEEATQLLVEYHFGRLPPHLNAAVEAHVRACPSCRRQGIDHAVTEKRVIQRKLRHMRPLRRLLSKRRRPLLLLLMVLIVFQTAVFELVRPDSPLAALLKGGSSATALGSPSPPTTPTGRTLTADHTFDAGSIGITALALSP